MSDILENLNPEQYEAVTAPEAPVMVVAGPGSGKTRVLAHRIAYLIDVLGVPPYRITAVTFTNRAAEQMRQRVDKLIGNDYGHQVALGTFHSICTRILRREAEHTPFTNDFVIYDVKDQLALIKNIIRELGTEAQQYYPNDILYAISAAKNEMISPEALVPQNHDGEIVKRVYPRYNKALQQANARDFDDLLLHVARLFRQHPDVLERYWRYFSHVMIDEFQDTNIVQYEIIKLLCSENRRIFVVGDPDQSIYGFRGADYRNIQRFQEDFSPKLILLRENYRSHQFILDAAMGLIRHNPDHIQRDLVSARADGPKLIIHENHTGHDEAQYIYDVIQTAVGSGEYKLSDFAVLYRTNSQSRLLEDIFVRGGLPHILIGSIRFYDRREIKDMMSYLRVVHNPLDTVSMQRIINIPPRGIGPVTEQKFFSWAATLDGYTWEALQTLVNGGPTPLSGRVLQVLTEFAELIVNLRQTAENGTPLEVLDDVLDLSDYLTYLERDSRGNAEERKENIAELRRVTHTYADHGLSNFLRETALVSDIDYLTDTSEAVRLMTLHAAKGQEFRVVFLVGMEEGILPHRRALESQDPADIAEERRLVYVGITRAQEEVHLTFTFRRTKYGSQDLSLPSRFLLEIPPSTSVGMRQLYWERPSWGTISAPEKFETTWQPQRKPTSERESKPKPTRTFRSGQKVLHPVFGEGIVISTSGSYGNEVVEVLFKQDSTTSKKLDPSYLQAIE